MTTRGAGWPGLTPRRAPLLTNQSVNKMPAATTRHAPPDTRARILAAAAEEFGARGFAAATVDRIAARARVNKAMIYYHFSNKRALYTTIVREHFIPVKETLDAIADAPGSASDKLDRLIDALVRAIDASKHFLPLFLREIADRGVHLGADELAVIAGIFSTVRGVIVQGTREQVFQPVHPGLAHFTIIAPVIMFRATAPIRERIRKIRHVEIPDADADGLAGHLRMVAHRMLAKREGADE
jgi:TetR/AcrR family transcriptional regulator